MYFRSHQTTDEGAQQDQAVSSVPANSEQPAAEDAQQEPEQPATEGAQQDDGQGDNEPPGIAA